MLYLYSSINHLYSSLIFDLDGTLVYTIDDIALAMNHALAKNGFNVLAETEYAPLVGNGIRKLAYDSLPQNKRAPEIVEKVTQDALAFYAEHPVVKSVPYKGILQVLEELRKRDIKMAVLSNKPDIVTKQVIDILFPPNTFAYVRGDILGHPRKPDAALVEEVLSVIERPSAETVIIGDSEVDIQTAKNFGCTGIGVCWGYRTKEVLVKAGADILLEDPLEILQALN